jgi:hypothetical protein
VRPKAACKEDPARFPRPGLCCRLAGGAVDNQRVLKWASLKRAASLAEDSAPPSGAQAPRLSRDQVVRLGQSGRPWDFIPVAERALQVTPQDAQIRVLAAANFARLRLRTLALESLAALEPGQQDNPNVRAISALMAQLPADTISVATRLARVKANLDALAHRAVDLRGHIPAWEARTARETWFAAGDGNVVCMGPGRPTRCSDELAQLRAADLGVRAENGPAGERVSADDTPWFLVEGIDPPWLFQKVIESLPRALDGYWPRVYLVQADPMEFLDGLAHADLRAELSQSRVEIAVGPDAQRRVREHMASMRGARLATASAITPGTRTTARPPLADVIVEAQSHQRTRADAARAAAEAHYRSLDQRAWARRFNDALARPAGDPLRVLIPTYRFSTFIRHSAVDLGAALTRLGCRVEVMMEPDESSKLSLAAYELALGEFKPDLVVRINYPRATTGWIDAPMPFVTWIQDAMPHLFREQVGSAQGDMDFVVGHLYPELFAQFGYPRSRTLDEPVSASAEKFHPGPVSEDLRHRLSCDVAYVSHQSETPEDLHRRLCIQAQAEPGLADVFAALRPLVEDAARGAMERFPVAALTDASRNVLRTATGRDPDERLVTRLTKQYAEPMGERIVRHAALEWAAAAARDRGWSFKIFGRAWDRHPTLRRFAAGELAHGEELRAAYRCAKVHLHMSLRTNMHQRVLECVLSGGTPLCLATRADYQAFKDAALRTALVTGVEPATTNFEDGRLGFDPSSHPAFASLARAARALKTPDAGTIWVGPARRDMILRERPAPAPPHAIALLGESCDCFFTGEADFRHRLGALLADDAARARAVQGARERVLEHATVDGLARRMLNLVGRELAAPASETTRGAA